MTSMGTNVGGVNMVETVTENRLMPRHRLSWLTGDIAPDERAKLIAEISRSDAPVMVDVLDDRVVYDWHRYEVAVELGKDITLNRLEDADPPGYLIRRLLGGRPLNLGQHAAIEVTLRLWRPTGRPKKTAKNASIPEGEHPTMTTMEMAAEAGVCATYIRMAKRVHWNGGEGAIRQVIAREVSLNAADVTLSGAKFGRPGAAASDRPDSVAAGPEAGDDAPGMEHGGILASLGDASGCGGGDDWDAPTSSFWVLYAFRLMTENRELKRANGRLEKDNRSLKAKAERLSGSQPGITYREPDGRSGAAPETQPTHAGEAASAAGPHSDDVDGQLRLLF